MSINHLKNAQQRLRHIAAEWPADPLRPNLQLKTFLSALSDHPALSARAVAATNALQMNRVSCQIPVQTTVMRPASMPQHYVRLKEGYEKSLKGIGRPWWKIFFGVW
ncbi:hypothetical protein B0F90DRAFT_1811208 [Multifurca ochricompacta]|uniref:Uncharacterized protein n=1 Tax=Multifurca ochricompacta TaxID=376703 RepID=A0AAD4QLL9_9AGAM|nr:hypothetical protein B0F90DRAFT_1811208 [Multifurca ochricompacta]